jgi:hypothetical protein
MALGWFNHLAKGRAIAWSGGSEPAVEVNPAAVAAMREVGIDIGPFPPAERPAVPAPRRQTFCRARACSRPAFDP